MQEENSSTISLGLHSGDHINAATYSFRSYWTDLPIQPAWPKALSELARRYMRLFHLLLECQEDIP